MWKYVKSGYTIIEILVALSILGIIFSTGFASFRDFSRRQVLSGAVRALKGDLRLAQQYSLIGKKPDDPDCALVNPLDGYSLLVNSSTQYIIQASCSAGLVDVKIVDLPADVSLSAPSPNPIIFEVLGQGTNLSGDATITLTQLSTGDENSIIVTKGGEIK